MISDFSQRKNFFNINILTPRRLQYANVQNFCVLNKPFNKENVQISLIYKFWLQNKYQFLFHLFDWSIQEPNREEGAKEAVTPSKNILQRRYCYLCLLTLSYSIVVKQQESSLRSISCSEVVFTTLNYVIIYHILFIFLLLILV